MKTTCYFFYFFVFLFSSLQAQPSHPQEAAVLEALYAYINGRNYGHPKLLKRAFFPEADLRYVKQDALHIWTVEEYIGRTNKGKVQPCKSRVVAVDIEGNAAQAKIEIEYPQGKFIDYLNLLKEGNEWRIAVKTFSKMPIKKRVLFVLTSHEQLGTTDRKTGFHLGEVSHVYKPLHDAGFSIDFVSPKGGQTHFCGVDLNDPTTSWLVRNSSAYYQMTHAMKPADVNPTNYAAIYYVGGHGTMWDFPNHEQLNELARNIYENGGIIAAVCHGPSGLVNVQLTNGTYLVDGKQLTSFTDVEEEATGQIGQVPFLLETTLRKRGARFSNQDPRQKHVVVDDRLITGQNPASAAGLAEALIQALQRPNPSSTMVK